MKVALRRMKPRDWLQVATIVSNLARIISEHTAEIGKLIGDLLRDWPHVL